MIEYMRGKFIIGLTLLFAAMIFGAWRGNAMAADIVQNEKGSTCVVCHGKISREAKNSIHTQNAVQCVDCHGGDPTQDVWEKAMIPAKGFKGKFAAVDILFLCSRCHGDYEKMRQFDIPIDQLQQYRTSQHGKALFLTGNDKVAVCTSCHGIHNILDVKDSKSPVYPTNVPHTCGKCHADKKLMKQFNIPGNEVEEYLKGGHGQRLQKMDLAVPTCATCHGNHGAAPPGVVEVVNVCGRCHQNIRDEFKKSRHYRKGLNCDNCHNNHNNRHPNESMFSKTGQGGCLFCHKNPKSKQGKYIASLIKNLNGARQSLALAENSIDDAETRGFFVDNEKVLLQEANTSLLEFNVKQHAFSRDGVDSVLMAATSKAAHIQETIKAKYEVVTDRRIIMACVVGYLLVFLFLFSLNSKG